MKSLDLRDIFSGLLLVLLFAVAVGKFDDLRAFALKEGSIPLKGIAHHRFFPKNFDVSNLSPRSAKR